MNRVEYLSLPLAERKRMAAKRTQERTAAVRAGRVPPPTLKEEFGGLVPAVGSGVVKCQKVPGSKRAPESKKVVDEVRREELRRSLVAPAERRVDQELFRTIRGYLHCVHRQKMDQYEKAAQKVGYIKKFVYRAGTQYGVIFHDGFSKEMEMNIRCILSGTHPREKILYGKDAERTKNDELVNDSAE